MFFLKKVVTLKKGAEEERKKMSTSKEKNVFDFGHAVTSSEELASAYLALKRLEALCEKKYTQKNDMFDALMSASALTVKVKQEINAFLKKQEGKEFFDFDKETLAGKIALIVGAACEASFVTTDKESVSETELLNRLAVLRLETSKLPLMTAQLESELSMQKLKKQG